MPTATVRRSSSYTHAIPGTTQSGKHEDVRRRRSCGAVRGRSSLQLGVTDAGAEALSAVQRAAPSAADAKELERCQLSEKRGTSRKAASSWHLPSGIAAEHREGCSFPAWRTRTSPDGCGIIASASPAF